MVTKNKCIEVPEGYEVIFRPWKTDKHGNRIYASQYGKKAWPILVKKK